MTHIIYIPSDVFYVGSAQKSSQTHSDSKGISAFKMSAFLSQDLAKILMAVAGFDS